MGRTEGAKPCLGKPGREELDVLKYSEKKSSGSCLYQLCLAVMFPHSMVILSAMLGFECLDRIEYGARRVTQAQLREPWWSLSLGADSTITTRSQPGKAGTMCLRAEALPAETWLLCGTVCVQGL